MPIATLPKRLFTALVTAACCASLAAADSGSTDAGPWENRNPGAGGRFQDVVLDPHTPGRAHDLSDMEGLSRTDDHGQSWQYLGRDIAYPNTLTVAIEPGNPDRVYLGSVGGIEVSDDAGQTWERIEDTDDPITQIAGDQTLFRVDTTEENWQQDWQMLYTQFVKEMDGVRFYRTRGVQCTFVFDATGDGEYVVQANADNAIK